KNKHIDAGFFDKDKAITIYNAVDNRDISYNSTTSKGARNVGFIGRLTKEKGFDIFCRMAEKYNNQNFIAAGEFEYNKDAEELKELASKNNIKLLGHCPVTEFMKMVDLIVLPIKWQEPFGRVVLESVFSGKIILTNKVGGITELASMLPNVYFLEDIQDLNDVPQYKQIPNQVFDKFNSESITREYEK
ncbi:glycosyltransferase, partial [Escherichia coli]|nr:glycosyltransferase [Escherichia coli]